MEHKAVYLLFCNFTLHVSDANHTHHPSNVANLATLEGGSCINIWPVPEAVVTVLCAPDDGCG